jgi:hypothetical protein
VAGFVLLNSGKWRWGKLSLSDAVGRLSLDNMN